MLPEIQFSFYHFFLFNHHEGGLVMKLMKMLLKNLANITQYLSDGVLRIFSPNRDNYPATGAQAFMGDPDPKNAHKK